jgi:3-oxoacyl-[acyl-carrier protein] reductase
MLAYMKALAPSPHVTRGMQPMKRLSGKVAIVTGASKGIGAGIAKRFGAEGSHVVVNYASDRTGAEKVATEIEASGVRALCVQCDVSKREDVARLFAETLRAFERVDIVVNNAGIPLFGPFEQQKEEEIRRQLEVNVLGTILVCQEAVRRFAPNGGSIINMSSIGSKNTSPTHVTYSATKGAVDTLTLGLSRELGPRNIRVNSIAPGAIETEGLTSLGFVDGSDMKKHVLSLTPLGRAGKPDDVAKVAVFLASDDADFLTGERVMVSGGWR